MKKERKNNKIKGSKKDALSHLEVILSFIEP